MTNLYQEWSNKVTNYKGKLEDVVDDSNKSQRKSPSDASFYNKYLLIVFSFFNFVLFNQNKINFFKKIFVYSFLLYKYILYNIYGLLIRFLILLFKQFFNTKIERNIEIII